MQEEDDDEVHVGTLTNFTQEDYDRLWKEHVDLQRKYDEECEISNVLRRAQFDLGKELGYRWKQVEIAKKTEERLVHELERTHARLKEMTNMYEQSRKEYFWLVEDHQRLKNATAAAQQYLRPPQIPFRL